MSDTPNPGDRGRFSSRRKTDAVLRLLRGERPRTGLARAGRHRRHPLRLAGRLPGRRTGRAEEPAGRRPGRRDRPAAGQGRRADHGQRAADPALPGRPPFRPEEAEDVGQTASPSTGRRYGLARVCRIWDLPRSTVYFRRHRRTIPIEQRPAPKRRGPLGPCSDEELVGHIRRVLAESPFHGEGYRKVWARLRYQGIRTSKERVRRLMREHGLQAPQRVGHPHGPKAHDGTIITERPTRCGAPT